MLQSAAFSQEPRWRFPRSLPVHLFPFLLIVSSSIFAQGGPPLQTNDPGTPGSGNWEINIGLTADRRNSGQRFDTPDIDCALGLGNRWQLKFEIPWTVGQTRKSQFHSGVGNSLMAVKWKFYEDERAHLAVATYPQLEAENPTDSARLGLATPGTKLLLPIEAEKQFGRFAVNGELGYRFVQSAKDEWISGLAVGHQLKKLELLGELYGTGQIGGEHETTIGVGGRYKLSRYSQLLFMFGRGLPGPSTNEPQFIGYVGIRLSLSGKRQSFNNKHLDEHPKELRP